MREVYDYYDSVSINSNGYTIVSKPVDAIPRKDVSQESLANLKDSRIKGRISPQSKRRLKKILDNWISAVYYYRFTNGVNYDENLPYITAITLTLPNITIFTQREIKKKMLSVFFIYLKRYCGVNYYFWKAELQKNGQIHFHCLVDRYIPKEKINKYWNESLERNGYLKNYKEIHGHSNAPSARIEKIRSKTKAIAYFIKYALKDEENGIIDGAIFGMSDELRELRNLNLIINGNIRNDLRRNGVISSNKVFEDKYFKYYRFEVFNNLKKRKCLLARYYQSYLSYIYDSLYNGHGFSYSEFSENYDNFLLVD